MPDPQLGQLVASVYEETYKSDPDDNVFESRATLFALGEKGFKKSLEGGRLIEATIEYAENTTMAMIGENDTISTSQNDVFDAARSEWKTSAGTISYSFLEAARARGRAAKFNVIEGKIENGRQSHFALLNRQFWNTSTPGANEITAIPTIISTAPSSGTVFGIDGGTFTFWRNIAVSGAKTTNAFDNLVSSMRSVFNQVSLGGVKQTPTALIGGRADLEGYEQTQQTLLRYMYEGKPGKLDAGFKTSAINYKGVPFMYDEDAPSGRIYFLNNNILRFEYLAGNWAKLGDELVPTNQLKNVHQIWTFGNFISGARRHLGVVYDIT
jgi:hypothetical protein